MTPTRALPPPTRPLPASALDLDRWAILQELPPVPGADVWLAYRIVSLWASPQGRGDEGPLRERVETIREAVRRAPAPELADALLELAEALDGAARPERIAAACARLSLWSHRQGAIRTSCTFLDLSATATPDDPVRTYAAGRVAFLRAARATSRSDWAQGQMLAEVWYERTVRVALRRMRPDLLALALIGLGDLYVWVGEFPEAVPLYRRAHRVARRLGRRAITRTAARRLDRLGRSPRPHPFLGGA